MIRESMAMAIARSGMRQVAICQRVGITQKHLSEFLNGHGGMSVELLDAIGEVLGKRWMLGSERDHPRDRVLMFLLVVTADNALSGREVARKLGMPIMTTSNYLHALALSGAVHSRKCGRTVLWWGAST